MAEMMAVLISFLRREQNLYLHWSSLPGYLHTNYTARDN